jgi:hypothetical protein
VKAAIGGLDGGGRRVRAEVRRESRMDDTFEDLRDEIEVGNGTIASEVIGR